MVNVGGLDIPYMDPMGIENSSLQVVFFQVIETICFLLDV